LLQKRFVGIYVDVYAPYLLISAFKEFPCNRIPPPLAWLEERMIECLLEPARQKVHFPYYIRRRLGKQIIRIGSQRTGRIVVMNAQVNLFYYTFDIVFPGTPQMHIRK